MELADYIRIATYYILFLFGIGFITHRRVIQFQGALLGALFFFSKGWVTVFAVAAIGIVAKERLFQDDMIEPSQVPMQEATLPKITRAPEFTDLGPWHNSEPFTLESARGKVVLIDFWTYSCINCIRTLPYIQGYWKKYGRNAPFILLGVHSPEFVFEKSEKNVAEAIERHGLTYPIAQDNDFGTWRAFSNHYWPAQYLIDANGYIRYTHFGEGGSDEIDRAIQSLLQEIGADVEGEPMEAEYPQRRDQTPETYLGARSWPALGNAKGEPSAAIVSYDAPAVTKLHKYYLVGDFQLEEDERQVLRSDAGEIRMRFLGSEINLVLGLGEGVDPVTVDVEADGEQTKTFTVDFDDLYNLYKGEYGEHEIILRIRGKGLEGYAFTFGS